MGKRHLAVLILVLLTLTACSISKTDEKKIRDIEFTVLDKEDIPEEFTLRIEEEIGRAHV